MRRLLSLILFFALSSGLALADPPQPVKDLLRDAVNALSGDDASSFMDLIDRSFKDYAALHEEIVGLLAKYEAGSNIVIVNDFGDDAKRTLDLDWLLTLHDKNDGSNPDQTRRQLIKCQVQKQGKRWKIVSLQPLDFFRYN